ncbi:MAG: hypothetical protein AB7F43_09520 [Bacteriovoracia bacterium]
MEANSNEKKELDRKAKVARPSNRALLAVKKDTKRRVLQELAKINKKNFGKRVHTDELISMALGLIQSEHVIRLQEESLSNADRLEQEYEKFAEKNQSVSKDEFLGKLLRGEISGIFESGLKPPKTV